MAKGQADAKAPGPLVLNLVVCPLFYHVTTELRQTFPFQICTSKKMYVCAVLLADSVVKPNMVVQNTLGFLKNWGRQKPALHKINP